MTPNPHRAEVALPMGDRQIILRCSYGAIAKMLPYLYEAPDDVAARRMKWLGVATGDGSPRTLDQMEWHNHLLGAVAATETQTVAACIAILAEEHQPDVTAEDVMRESPSWGLVWRAFIDLRQLFHWRPGEVPEVAENKTPFHLARLSRALSRWRQSSASAQPISGG